MKKIFLETSVFIRVLTGDDQKKQKDIVHLLTDIEKGLFYPYISNIVILEIYYVLTSVYRFNKPGVLKDLEKITKMRNLTILETTDSLHALKLSSIHKIKYSDCLIATQVPKDALLITYDADFEKIPHLKVRTPDRVSL